MGYMLVVVTSAIMLVDVRPLSLRSARLVVRLLISWCVPTAVWPVHCTSPMCNLRSISLQVMLDYWILICILRSNSLNEMLDYWMRAFSYQADRFSSVLFGA